VTSRLAMLDPRCGARMRAVEAAILDHHFDHHGTLFRSVGCRSSSFRMPVDLHRRTGADPGESSADAWESRGRRFKSCQRVDGKPQIRGRVRRNPERPLTAS
jgi:hypothetical protein